MKFKIYRNLQIFLDGDTRTAEFDSADVFGFDVSMAAKDKIWAAMDGIASRGLLFDSFQVDGAVFMVERA